MHNYRLYYEDDSAPIDGIDRHYPSKEISYKVSFPEDTTWHNVLQEFARFLDATGYVGVADAVDGLVNERQLKEYYENTSNTGLSD